MEKRECPDCQKSVRVKKDGSLWAHDCPIPGKDPRQAETPVNRTAAGRLEEKPGKGPWFGASYESDCDGCGNRVFEGDQIRADGQGGWECEEWCGQDDPAEPATTGPHRHKYVWADVPNGGPCGMFCEICGEEEPVATGPARGTAPAQSVSDAVESFLNSEPEPPKTTVSGQPEPRRDRWGRYLLPGSDGKVVGRTRATTFAKELSDTFGIAQWQQRNVAIGLTKRADLFSQVIGKDVRKDRNALNKICDDAREAAGEKISASAGTAVHHLTERVDADLMSLADVPDAYRDSVGAYLTEMANAGLVVVPELIERTTMTTAFGEPVAGTMDRVVRCPDGRYRIADVKTGQDPLEYGDHEIGVQLLTYALGYNEIGVYDWNEERWRGSDGGVRRVATDFAIVIHLPLEGELAGGCFLHKVDLGSKARRWADMCAKKRAEKKTKWSSPLTTQDFSPTAGNWADRFASVRTREEARALYDEASAAGLTPESLKSMAELAMKTLEVMARG